MYVYILIYIYVYILALVLATDSIEWIPAEHINTVECSWVALGLFIKLSF